MMEPTTVGATVARDWRARVQERVKNLPADVDVPEGETPEDVAERKAKQAANKASRWRNRLPMEYADASVDLLDDDQGGPVCRAFLDAPQRTLLLAGPTGRGKTYAAYAVGNAAVARGLYVEAWTVAEWLDAQKPGREGDDPMHRACAADVLILDDLGVGYATEWAITRMEMLVDSRTASKRKTVITTNLTREAMDAAWGDRVRSRIAGGALVVRANGEDRRPEAW